MNFTTIWKIRRSWQKKCARKVLAIKNKEVVGIFKGESEALEQSVREHELGTFLIQTCSPDPDSVFFKVRTPIG